MKAFMILTSLVLILSSAHAGKLYGEKITIDKAITIGEAINKNSSKEVLVKAEVTKVCKMKGCWLMLKDKNDEYRVTFSDYGTTVPMSLIGKKVLVQGKLKEKKLTLAQTKHYIEDEGGDPSSVTKPRVEYRIVATGVQVQN